MESEDEHLQQIIVGILLCDYSKSIVDTILELKVRCEDGLKAVRDIFENCWKTVMNCDDDETGPKKIDKRDFWRVCSLELENRSLHRYILDECTFPCTEQHFRSFSEYWKDSPEYKEFKQHTYFHNGSLMLSYDYVAHGGVLNFDTMFIPIFSFDLTYHRIALVSYEDLEEIDVEVPVLSMVVKCFTNDSF